MALKPGKYLKSEDNGAIFVYDEVTAKLPQMRVIEVTEVADEVEVVAALAVEKTREELEALFIEKFKRKPHPRMGLEKMRAAVEDASGNDPGDGDT